MIIEDLPTEEASVNGVGDAEAKGVGIRATDEENIPPLTCHSRHLALASQ